MNKFKFILKRVGSNLLTVCSLPVQLVFLGVYVILMSLFLFLKNPSRDNLHASVARSLEKAYDVLDHLKAACGCAGDILKL